MFTSYTITGIFLEKNFPERLMGWAVFKSGLDRDGIKFEPSELVRVSGRRPVV